MKTTKASILFLSVALNLFGCGGEPYEQETNTAALSTNSTEANDRTLSPTEAQPVLTSSVHRQAATPPPPAGSCRRCVICDNNGRHCGKPVCCED